MAPKAGATDQGEAQAPGARVVKALANDLAAGFTAAAIEQAHDALKRELEERKFPDGAAMGLTPVERKMLEVLQTHPAQLVAATTVPEGGAS